MGIEYRHYLVPRDLDYEPVPDLVFRVHEALRLFGLSDEPPLVIDHDVPVVPPGRAKRRGRVRRDGERPREAAYDWSLDGSTLSESVTQAAFRVFGGRFAWDDALYFRPMLYVGPAWKVISVIGVQSGYAVRAPADPPYAHDWHYLSHVFDERPEVALAWPLQSGSDGQPIEPVPEDWIPATFRVGLVLDFFKSLPSMADERVPRIPRKLRSALEFAFGTPLAQGFGWS